MLTEVIAGLYEPDEHGRRRPESLYGSLKMWAHLQRQGVTVARCTVERIMRAYGWVGVTRAKRVRTTIPDPGADRAPDLVKRRFGATRPNELFVADFTYVPMSTGVFAYTAFVVDAFAGTIVGWEFSTSKVTAFVERAIRQGADKRRREGHPLQGNTIHHSGRENLVEGSSRFYRIIESDDDQFGHVFPHVRGAPAGQPEALVRSLGEFARVAAGRQSIKHHQSRYLTVTANTTNRRPPRTYHGGATSILVEYRLFRNQRQCSIG